MPNEMTPTVAPAILDYMKVARPKNLSREPEWKKGLAAAVDELQAFGGGVVGLAGQAATEVLPEIARPYAEDVRDWGLDTYKENIEESTAGWQQPNVARVEDIKLGEEGGAGRLGDWAAYQGSKGVATLASLALGGGVGGAIAKQATSRAVKHIAKQELGKRVMGKTVTKALRDEKRSQINKNIARGAKVGAGVGAFGLEGGGSFGQFVDEGVAPSEAALPAAVVGLINTALELVAPLSVAKKLGLDSWVSKGLAKQIKADPEVLGKKAQRLAAKMAKGATTTAAKEGITEGIQELVQIAGGRIAKDEELLAALSEEDRSQILNAAAAGGFTGATVGGAAGPFMKTQESADEAAKAPAAQAEAEAGAQKEVGAGQLEPGAAQPAGEIAAPLEYADWLEQTKARSVESVQPEEAGGLYEEYQVYRQQTINANEQAVGKPGAEELESQANLRKLAKRKLHGFRSKKEDLGNKLTNMEGGALPLAELLGVEAEPNRTGTPEYAQISEEYDRLEKEEERALQELSEVDPNIVYEVHYNGPYEESERGQKFGALGAAQRGAPEQAMNQIQDIMDGGNYSYLVEHVGDLTHRFTTHNPGSYGKIGRALDILNNQADMRKLKGMQRPQRLKEATAHYTKEHEKLPVYNAAQKLARDAAVALGKFDFEKAKRNLEQLNKWEQAGELHRKLSAFKPTKGELESRAQKIAKPVQQVEDETIAELGRGWVKRAQKLGIFEIVDAEGNNGQSASFNPTTGKITVYAKSLTEGSSAAQVLHEASHATMDELIEGKLGNFVTEVNAQGEADHEGVAGRAVTQAETAWMVWQAEQLDVKHKLWDTTGEAWQVEWKRVSAEVAAALKTKPEEWRAQFEQDAENILKEETFAYYVQYAHDEGKGSGLFRKAVNSIKAGWLLSGVGKSLSKVGLKPKMSDGLAVELARRSSRFATELRAEMQRPIEAVGAETGAASVVEGGDELESYAGEAAETADHYALGRADARLKAGADPEGQIDRALHAPANALERVTQALGESRIAEDTLQSRPESMSSAWLTDATSGNPAEVNNPGFLNKLKTAYVDKFSDLAKMSKEAYAKFNLARSKRSGEQKNFESDFVKPWVDLIGDLIKGMSKQGKKFTVENANDSVAAWHIVNDKVNRVLAEINANEEAIRLEKELAKYAGSLEKDDPLGAEARVIGIQLQKGRRNLLKGLTWEGEKPVAADGVSSRTMTVSEVRGTLKNKVEAAYDAAIGNTEVWKLSTPLANLRINWEGLKNHGSGMATPETASARPEVRAAFEERLALEEQPQNAHEVYGRVKNNEVFIRLAKEAKKIAHKSREQLVKGGLIAREEADAMGQVYKHWIPLHRKAFDFQHAVDAQFQRMGGFGKGTQIRTGTSAVDAPVHTMQNLMASYDAAVTASESNQARSFLAKLVEENPGHWTRWFSVEKDPEYKKSHGKYGFVETRAAGGGPMDIPFYRDGERYYIKVVGTNQRAKTLSTAIRNLDSQELGPVMNVMNKVNSWIRWVNISASPAFLLMNAPRDYFTARLNLKATEIADHGKAVRKEVGPSMRALINHYIKGKKDAGILEWERAGGRISFVESLRPNDESWGSIEAQIRHRQGDFNFGPGMEANLGAGVGAAVGQARNALEKMETINIIAENVMRYSVWKVARAKGLSTDQAAMLSKDITTNFDRRGLRAQGLGVYWLFYNATIQGNTQVLRNVFYGPNKKKLWGAMSAVMAMAFLNDQIGALTSDDEDDDGRSDWDSAPDWKKEKFARIAGSNMLWPGEDSTYATVPLPWVFNVIWRFGEMASEVARGKKDAMEVPADMVGMLVNTFNPIGSGDASVKQMVAPTALDPLVQIWENTSAFGRPLGPTRFPGQEFLPDSEMAWLNEPKGYKWLAREVNKITGGSVAEQGGVDWRPSTYRTLADTIMGGGGRFFKQLATGAAGVATDNPPEMKDTPGLRTFFFTPGDPIESELYHERVSKIEQAKKAEKTFRTGPERDLQELQRVRDEYSGELRMVSMATDVERQLKAMRKQLRTAQGRGQENRVEMLKRRIEKAKERFNKAWTRRLG